MRRVLACKYCRLHKRKCVHDNGKGPCEYCTKMGFQDDCEITYPIIKHKKPKIISDKYIDPNESQRAGMHGVPNVNIQYHDPLQNQYINNNHIQNHNHNHNHNHNSHDHNTMHNGMLSAGMGSHGMLNNGMAHPGMTHPGMIPSLSGYANHADLAQYHNPLSGSVLPYSSSSSSGGENTTYMHNNIHSVNNFPNVNDIHNIPNVKDINNIHNIHNIHNVNGIHNIPNFNEIHNVSNVNDIHNTHNVNGIHNIPNFNEIHNIPNVSDNHNIPNVNDNHNIPNVNDIHNIPKVNDIHNIPNGKEKSPSLEFGSLHELLATVPSDTVLLSINLITHYTPGRLLFDRDYLINNMDSLEPLLVGSILAYVSQIHAVKVNNFWLGSNSNYVKNNTYLKYCLLEVSNPKYLDAPSLQIAQVFYILGILTAADRYRSSIFISSGFATLRYLHKYVFGDKKDSLEFQLLQRTFWTGAFTNILLGDTIHDDVQLKEFDKYAYNMELPILVRNETKNSNNASSMLSDPAGFNSNTKKPLTIDNFFNTPIHDENNFVDRDVQSKSIYGLVAYFVVFLHIFIKCYTQYYRFKEYNKINSDEYTNLSIQLEHVWQNCPEKWKLTKYSKFNSGLDQMILSMNIHQKLGNLFILKSFLPVVPEPNEIEQMFPSNKPTFNVGGIARPGYGTDWKVLKLQKPPPLNFKSWKDYYIAFGKFILDSCELLNNTLDCHSHCYSSKEVHKAVLSDMPGETLDYLYKNDALIQGKFFFNIYFEFSLLAMYFVEFKLPYHNEIVTTNFIYNTYKFLEKASKNKDPYYKSLFLVGRKIDMFYKIVNADYAHLKTSDIKFDDYSVVHLALRPSITGLTYHQLSVQLSQRVSTKNKDAGKHTLNSIFESLFTIDEINHLKIT